MPVCEASRYEEILTELNAGGIELDTRRKLAAEAFAHTAAYETSIAAWFADVETFPPRLLLSLERETELAARTRTSAPPSTQRRGCVPCSRGSTCSAAGSCPSTTSTTSTPRAVLREFALPACVIVKHANPCGVAVAATIEEAYAKALAGDPVSAYGGVVALNRRACPSWRPPLAGQFVEVLIAPEYDAEGLAALKVKEALRILRDRERRGAPAIATFGGCSGASSSRTPTPRWTTARA